MSPDHKYHPAPPALPPTVSPGDRVAIMSPSWAAPAVFPAIHEAALARVRDDLGLIPVEYPTTRVLAAPAERARDLMAAFADRGIAAIMAVIGGDDQLTVIPHLDAGVARANPKPFFGYSDNTNLLNWLWCNGIAAWHGGSTQVHLGPGPGIDAVHLQTLRAALFGGGDVELHAEPASRDLGISWEDPRALVDPPPNLPDATGWSWHGGAGSARGRTWGGNIEVLQWILGAGHAVPAPDEVDGGVLLIETSEEVPPPVEVFRMLRVLGERGLLARFAAFALARPCASMPADGSTEQSRGHYREQWLANALRVIETYSPGVPVVAGLDFGHTSPQAVLPYGGELTVDAERQQVIAHFGSPRPAT